MRRSVQNISNPYPSHQSASASFSICPLRAGCERRMASTIPPELTHSSNSRLFPWAERHKDLKSNNQNVISLNRIPHNVRSAIIGKI